MKPQKPFFGPQSFEQELDAVIEIDIDYQEHERDAEPTQIDLFPEDE